MSTENKNETPAGGTKPASKQRGPRRAPRAPKAAPKAVAPQQEAQASRPPKGAARSGKPADKAVLSLPKKYRLPLYLYYYEGYSVGEIGAILGRNPSTIQTHLARGRERLKAMLTEEVQEHG